MRTPQLEDGFTRIANELFEAILGFGFSQRQLVVLLSILRKTYGYNKIEDDMSASQIGSLCGIKRNHVTETIGQLAKMNVITKRVGKYGLMLSINKDYQKWRPKVLDSPKSGLVPNQASPGIGLALIVPIREADSPESGQGDSPESGHTKENLSKENHQKKRARQEILFTEWIVQCKQNGKQPIPEDDPIFDYSKSVDLPTDFVRLAWVEFKRKHAESSKKYRNWNQHFSNAVRENWYGVWFEKDGEWQLTTRGKQIQKELKGKNENQRTA